MRTGWDVYGKWPLWARLEKELEAAFGNCPRFPVVCAEQQRGALAAVCWRWLAQIDRKSGAGQDLQMDPQRRH